MASSHEYGIEDITPSNSPDNESDSDDDEPYIRPAGSRIAHKEMKNIEIEKQHSIDNEDEKEGSDELDVAEEKQGKDDDSPVQKADFEDISSDDDGENEAFSPTEEDQEDQDMASPVSEDGTPAGSPLSPQDGFPAGSPLSPQDGILAHSPLSPQDGSPTHSPLSPQDGTPVGSPLSPQDGIPVHGPLSPQDGSPAHSPSSPQDGTPAGSPLSPQDGTPAGSPVSPISPATPGPATPENDSPNEPFSKVDDCSKDSSMADATEAKDVGSPEEMPDFDIPETKEPEKEGDTDLIDAPIPSPFSDIGDISGGEHAIITDILNQTGSGSHITSELEGFAQSLESAEVPVPAATPRREGDTEKEAAPEKENQGSDDEDESEENKTKQSSVPKTEEAQQPGGSDVGGLIADIFGDSDEEEEEFEGFGEEELQREKVKSKSRAVISDDESDDDDADDDDNKNEKQTAAKHDDEEEAAQEVGKVQMPAEEEDSSDDDRPTSKSEMISDFDLMMQRKKEAMSSRRRRKRDFEYINDNDDIIAAMIRSMREAAEEDRMLNQSGRAATKKLKMLDSVVTHLHKSDLQHLFIDGGILPAMKEWLSPLPDNSLPHIMIRKHFLKLLSEFPALDRGALKMSGIGRSIMLLYKHPKETRENRNLAGKIIAQWARPIFGVQTNFRDMSKEDREERDKLNAAEYKKRRLSSTDEGPSSASMQGGADDKRPKRPGDKGFIARARVPKASTRDYIIRPKSEIESSMDELGGGMKNPKKTLNRFEKQMRKFKDRKGLKGTAARAVSMSINGSKMAL